MVLTIFALVGALASAPVPSQNLTVCIWGHVPPSDKSAFVSAYHGATDSSGRSGYGILQSFFQSRDAALMSIVSECAGDTTVPKKWGRSYVMSLFMQAGASGELGTSRQIGAAALEDAWSHAPQASFDCLRAHAGLEYGFPTGNCTNIALIDPLLLAIGVQTTDAVAVQQALIFFNAKAGAGWGEYAVTRYVTEKAVASRPPAAHSEPPGAH